MSAASLTKFTVPLAGSQSATTQGLLMPKLKYRFRVSFLNFGVSSDKTELTKQVKTFARPQVQFSPFAIDVYNSKVWLTGKPEWQEVNCVLRDDAVGNISKLVGEQVQKQFDFMEQASASAGIDYKFTTKLELLDGGNGAHTPTVLETWEMYGCLLSSINYNEMDYGSSDPMEIALTMRYDNAIQSPSGTGIGTNVGRTLGQIVTG
jgi:hypothetical protein